MSHGIGIVGTGGIADKHALAVGQVEGAELVAVMSRSEERAKAFAERHGCRAYTSMSEFLDDPELDIVSICTPSGYHMEPALEAIAAGKHLVVEKPLEITLERCDAIIEAAAQKGVKVMGIFQSRFYDASRVLKETVEKGRFGRLVLGDAYVKWYRSQEYYDRGEWKGTWRFDGGGALMVQAIHAIDLLQWYMGRVDTVQAYAKILGHERIEVEDTAVATLEFENGALGVIEGSTAVYPGFLKRIEISGTEGSAIMEEEDFKAWTFAKEIPEDEEIRRRFSGATRTQGGAADPGAISLEGHVRQFQAFVDALREGREPPVDGYEARKAVAIILAIYESAKTGRKVKVDY
ncbi:oxidoreductase domain protein [Spirochaeta thermophila DSM 6578]|uniref:Oxidoreductase domain protein n=1 Tax=Winmispira thermophila (strain ATCC 700085 / DSM 6578 / Z-1203) TaxID=869211 RepID=G0GA76_WINT7|nr:Gfo/Idh/MocA family oxidoreductase [Spirochaeta thermophila]AEJ60912.1 oxidoreductase domain protein [Spirochaeta thermophila DSM 6578]